MLSIKKSKYNSILVSASSDEVLCDTFMRFQEHYESPNPRFRNRVFTRGEYLAWYSKTNGGATYRHDWHGFNFPSRVLVPFRQGLFDPLTKQETQLLNLLKYRYDNFYVIGANNTDVIRHELAHALYNYNIKYREEIDHLIGKNMKSFAKITKYILTKGYTKEVINDELQAYITDNDDEFIMNNLSQQLINQINTIYQKYNV